MFANDQFYWFNLGSNDPSATSTHNFELSVTIVVALAWIVLWAVTRKFFSEWKTTVRCVALLLAGISTYFLLSIFSMADPPMNWGYPRTVEGFFHVAGRGQYGSPDFAVNFHDLFIQWKIYIEIAVQQFGAWYLVAAMIPFFFLHKMPPIVRKWILGLIAVWFIISQLMLIGLDIFPDRSSYELSAPFFSATHFVLALLAGFGFMLAGNLCPRPAGNSASADAHSAS